MLLVVLAIPVITLDETMQLRAYAPLLISFFVATIIDGLMLLINWRMMELVPETLSGRILAFTAIVAPAGTCTVYKCNYVVPV